MTVEDENIGALTEDEGLGMMGEKRGEDAEVQRIGKVAIVVFALIPSWKTNEMDE